MQNANRLTTRGKVIGTEQSNAKQITIVLNTNRKIEPRNMKIWKGEYSQRQRNTHFMYKRLYKRTMDSLREGHPVDSKDELISPEKQYERLNIPCRSYSRLLKLQDLL